MNLLQPSSLPRDRRAGLVMASSALLFGVMAVMAKAAAARISGQEIAFVRFLIGIAACAGAATRIRFRVHNWRGLFWRGAFGGAAVACFFASIAHLAVGMATLLNYTSPVFTALFAWIFLREHIGRPVLAALAITTLGVVMVVVADAPRGALAFGSWQLVGILAAVLSGAAVTWIRELRKSDGSWEIFGAFCVGGALITAPSSLAHWVWPSPLEWLLIVGVGVTSVIAQILMTWSLRDLRAAAAGLLFQLTPISALVLGALVFGERFSGAAIVGAVITLVGVGWGAWLGSVRR